MNAHILREWVSKDSKTFGAVMLSMGGKFVIIKEEKHGITVARFYDLKLANETFELIKSGVEK